MMKSMKKTSDVLSSVPPAYISMAREEVQVLRPGFPAPLENRPCRLLKDDGKGRRTDIVLMSGPTHYRRR